MSELFYNSKFTGDISKWNVSNVTNMTSMFEGCKNFNCNLSKWDVHNVTNMERMFYNCKTFNSDLSKWNVKNCIYFFTMCINCFNIIIYNPYMIPQISAHLKLPLLHLP